MKRQKWSRYVATMRGMCVLGPRRFTMRKEKRAMTEWQPIETAPKDDTVVDLWAKRWDPETDSFHGERFPNCSWKKTINYWKGLSPTYRATHWMPLPEPPK